MARKKVATDWATPTGRVKWLLEHRHNGSRSTMAKATGVSLTGIIKVVTDQQTPGRRLLEKIAHTTDVNPAWLFAGEGQPFKGSAIPVVTACLPGAPTPREASPADEGVPEVVDLYSPSRYWLKLDAAESAVRVGGTNLRAGDLMLMDTDRATFPPVEELSGRWGVVRVPARGGATVRLAELTYFKKSDDYPAHLEAETFIHHPLKGQQIVIDEYPDGTRHVSRRPVLYEQPREGGIGGSTRDPWSSSILPHEVGYDDVVALCVLLIRRFG